MPKDTIKIAVAVIAILFLVGGTLLGSFASRSIKNEQQTTSVSDNGAQQQTQTSNQNQTTTHSTTMDSGLIIKDIAVGTGAEAANGDTLSMNYTGTLDNGTIFDSNVDPKFGHVAPFSFQLGAGRVIQGWEQGILGMKIGGKRELTIPASLGYGASGAGGLIPPNATLHFTVELLSIAGK